MEHPIRSRLIKTVSALVVVGLILGTPSIALGWGAGGHMMIASIAYSRLNPRAKREAIALLARPIDPASLSVKTKDFVNAAHWADDLRAFSEFDSLKALHYIDRPFSTDGTPLPPDLIGDENVVTALHKYVTILRTYKDKNEQALALRLIIHLVGDVHQPLHCATRVDSAHAMGDQGASHMMIKIAGDDGRLKTSYLHSYWDNGIGSFPQTQANFDPPSLKEIPPAVADAIADNPATNPALQLNDPFAFDAWSKESFQLAQDFVYKGVKNGTEPTLTYKRASLKVVRTRIAWAGYRLAALLNSIWPEKPYTEK